jgi:hypothetical protein
MKTNAWKDCENDTGVEYSLQFSEVPWKFRKALSEAMKDWRQTGYGWHKDSGNQIFIYRKTFGSTEEWENWAGNFPIQISESRFWGEREKVVIHGKKKK